MTIKAFSRLCGCSAQTLRYYDREDLLKPDHVDAWSGYRFYKEEQAVTFVKIRNLQKAGFTIEEIKKLLHQDDAEIYEAFETKIAEAEKRLQEIKNIQKTYQTEMTNMKKKIKALRQTVRESLDAYSPEEEFGISQKDYEDMIKNLDDFFERMAEEADGSKYELVDDTDENRKKEERNFQECLASPCLEMAFERHGWNHVKDFYGEIPALPDGGEYFFLFRLKAEKMKNTAFANTLLGILCMKNRDRKMNLRCNVMESEDGENHFWMLKARS